MSNDELKELKSYVDGNYGGIRGEQIIAAIAELVDRREGHGTETVKELGAMLYKAYKKSSEQANEIKKLEAEGGELKKGLDCTGVYSLPDVIAEQEKIIKLLKAEIAASTCADCPLPARVAEYQMDNTNLRIQRKAYEDVIKDKNDAIKERDETIDNLRMNNKGWQDRNDRRNRTIEAQQDDLMDFVKDQNETVKRLEERIERQRRTIDDLQFQHPMRYGLVDTRNTRKKADRLRVGDHTITRDFIPELIAFADSFPVNKHHRADRVSEQSCIVAVLKWAYEQLND